MSKMPTIDLSKLTLTVCEAEIMRHVVKLRAGASAGEIRVSKPKIDW
jgi:hypothetical protein